MTRRSLALGSLLGGSLLSLLASVSAGLSQDLTRALAVVALVGAVLIVVLGMGGRRVLGLLLGFLGLAMVLAELLLPDPAVPWRFAYAAGGALVAFGGLLTMITSAGWPAPANRFEQKETRTPADSGDPVDLWRAMDAGLDPTADPDVRKGDPGDTMRSANQSQQSLRRK
jgi:Tryptophan-associated transmembrane protein (Trp_oprn_chp)